MPSEARRDLPGRAQARRDPRPGADREIRRIKHALEVGSEYHIQSESFHYREITRVFWVRCSSLREAQPHWVHCILKFVLILCKDRAKVIS